MENVEYYEHIAGLVPGAVSDEANFALVGTILTRRGEQLLTHFDVRHLQIWPANASYGDIAKELQVKLRNPELAYGTTLLIDVADLDRHTIITLIIMEGAWIGAFLDETEDFPGGIHDDQVDGVSGAVAVLSAGGGVISNEKINELFSDDIKPLFQ